MNLPPYAVFPTLSNEQLMLRQIENSDLPSLIEISFYDEVQAQNLEQAMEMHAKIKEDYEKGESIHWGIIDLASHKIVGTCGYYRAFNKGEGELGCVLLPQYRGHGFMTAALKLAINFGLKELGLKRIFAITTQHNKKAINLLKRLNFMQLRLLDDNAVEFELTQ